MRWISLCAAACGLVSTAFALDPVSVQGNKFFNKDGSQFFIKGIAYQLTPDDPLVDKAQCQRDAALMSTLGTNALRVYHVDSSANHDGCMQTFADAGIYLLIDLDTFPTYILPDDLYWNNTQYIPYTRVMDAFQKYDNLLAFFVGNEVVFTDTDSPAAPYIKAAARDMKAYRDSKGYRKFPVGYSAADIKELRPMLQDYLTCGGNSSDNIDFFSINSYSWCGDSSYTISTYNELEEQARGFPVPIFFSETGCNVPEPRDFADQEAIFGPEMGNTFSGAIIYEWIQVQNAYGLIQYGPPNPNANPADTAVQAGYTIMGTPTPLQPDFDNLKSRWATLTPTGVNLASYTPSISTRACPSSTPGGWWQVAGNVKLPTLGQAAAGSDPAYTSAPTVSIAVSSLPKFTDPVSTIASGSSSGTATSGSSSSTTATGKSSGHNAAGALDTRNAVVGATLLGVVLGVCLLL